MRAQKAEIELLRLLLISLLAIAQRHVQPELVAFARWVIAAKKTPRAGWKACAAAGPPPSAAFRPDSVSEPSSRANSISVRR
jgi:hypothetical protein